MMWMTLELMALASTLMLVLILVLVRNRGAAKRSRLPPRPRGVPVLGHLPLMRTGSPGARCAEWAKECGPVFRIKVGVVDVVVLNDFESIKNFLCKKEGLYRPENMVFSNVGVNGVATLNGPAWLENRRISMRILRDLGFGKKGMEGLVREETRQLVEKLVKTNGLPIVTLKQFTPSASNVISRVLFGERDASTSPRGMAMVENLDKFSKALGAGSLIEVLPQWARHLVLLLPFTRSVALRRFVQNLIELGR
ncbi:putative cytochrome P450 [Ixodes scapularis]